MLLTPIRTVSDQRLSCDFTVAHFRVGHIASLGLRRGDFVFGPQSRRGHLGTAWRSGDASRNGRRPHLFWYVY